MTLRALRDSVVTSPLAKNRRSKALLNRDNGVRPLVGVFFDNQKTQQGLLERTRHTFRPKFGTFWNVRMSQGVE
jgi:hypothetical protein